MESLIFFIGFLVFVIMIAGLLILLSKQS